MKFGDLLLLLLYSPGVFSGINEPIEGLTKLNKKQFLDVGEIKENEIPAFYPFIPGPFTTDVYTSISCPAIRL